MRENKLQTDCLKYLDSEGIYNINTHGGGWTGKGTPDIVVCLDGRFVAFELKVDKNDLEPAQRIHKKRIEKNGGRHYSPRTLTEFKEIIKELRGR